MVDPTEVALLTADHLGLTAAGVLGAAAIALPLGVVVTRPGMRRHSGWILALVGALQTVPSLAILAFAMLALGLGGPPALLALALYALLPLLHNTVAGLQGVPEDLREAACGLGMAQGQILWRVELPVALPVILRGLRTATVLTIGTAALAAEIGAPCLGDLIFQGISTGSIDLILAGAVPTAVLAVLADGALSWAGRALVSEGLRA